ncbi:MAG: hypothetical protein H7122_16390 [Chitinophagaceae bacterium]|nr:hypothetical protein [Chitinophagaceae bacterium]
MNRTAIIYSRSFLGLDIKVWTTLLVVIFISILLFGFKIINNTSCISITVVTQGTMPHKQSNVFYVNESISFTASARNAKKVEWDFADGSSLESGAEKKHSFSAEGDYLVTVIVNGKCKEILPVAIKQRGANSNLLTGDNTPQSPIVGNSYATAGAIETYRCNTQAAVYKWTIENSASFEEKLGQSVSFSFSDTGTYNLILQLDDDENKVWKQTIFVRSVSGTGTVSDPSFLPPPDLLPLPRTDPVRDQNPPTTSLPDATAPPIPVPVPIPVKPTKKYIQLPRPELETMLKDVVEKKRNVPDFDYILCNGGNTIVTANQKTMTFAELCKKLQDRRGIFKAKVKDIKISSFPYEPEAKCLVTLVLEYK